MTDERLLAEEHICNGKCQDDITRNYVHCKTCTRIKDFLAGLKAGRPQWHDLRKDKNDLPKFEGDYMCALLNSTHSSFNLSFAIEDGLKYWQDCEDTDWTNEVIAWCEIPTFDKE